MNGPDIDFRRSVAERIRGIQEEDALEELLQDILNRVISDISDGFDEQPPDQVLSMAEAWLSVASYALNGFYSPASMRPDFAGWSKGAVDKLRKIADVLRPPLNAVVRVLRSAAYSIGVAFPFGASISLTWQSTSQDSRTAPSADVAAQLFEVLKDLGNDDPEVDLFFAISKNDGNGVKSALGRGANIDAREREVLERYKGSLAAEAPELWSRYFR